MLIISIIIVKYTRRQKSKRVLLSWLRSKHNNKTYSNVDFGRQHRTEPVRFGGPIYCLPIKKWRWKFIF